MANSLIIWTLRNRNLKEILFRVIDLFGYLLIPFAAIMPRKKNLWVFGYKTGFNDNPKYLFLYTLRNHPEINAIWISRNKSEQRFIAALGFQCYYRWSLIGLWTCLRAKVYIFSSDTSDINYWTSMHATKINLWHGVGIKKLGYKGDITYNANNRINRLLTPALYEYWTYFITTSDLMDQHFRDCYKLLPEQTKQIGYPRCDFLQANKDLIDEYIEKYETKDIQQIAKRLKQHKRVYVYMPTFRDDQSDYIAHSGIDFAQLNELMIKQQAIFLLKLHPATRTNVEINNYSNIIMLDKKVDIYPLLPKTDVLITDYSSIYYDYQLMSGKRILLFPFDYSEYIQNSRDLAYDYDEYTPGHKYQTWEELEQAIQDIESAPTTPNCWVTNMFWGKNYQNSSQKLVELLKNT